MKICVLFLLLACVPACDDSAYEQDRKIRSCQAACAADHRVMKTVGHDYCTCENADPGMIWPPGDGGSK